MAIAIMQGRLVPPSDGRIQCFPRERWRDEFDLAGQAGLDAIEWIYDEYGADVNPIATDEGVELIRDLSAQSGVQVRSVCADYFMEKPLLRANAREIEERTQTLEWLLGQCSAVGATRVVLPFVDASRIDSDGELRTSQRSSSGPYPSPIQLAWSSISRPRFRPIASPTSLPECPVPASR